MAVKVLVVDDEKMIVKGLRFSLQQDGYEVECAYDGEEALGMIRERQYDIVLLDVMLPKRMCLSSCSLPAEMIWIRSWGLTTGRMIM